MDHQHIVQIVELSLAEDVGSGDLTAALIERTQQAKARIVSREDAIVCGIPWASEVFKQVDDSIAVQWQVAEGEKITANEVIGEISGNARHILTAERCALNFLQALSGTATTVNHYVRLIEHTRCRLLDTRKTIPGLRLAQKHAVAIGGGENHRFGLYDGVLIKENHIRATGSLKRAVSLAKAHHGDTILVEVEVESLAELEQALKAGATRIMLDNFKLEQLRKAVDINGARAELEASGNITHENIRDIAQTGVDYISLGALTKHIQAIDLSLLFEFTG